MITYLTGTIIPSEGQGVVIETHGVGYRVLVSPQTKSGLSHGEISLWVHQAVRETSMELFGFTTESELSFFELLIGVSGVGPRSALSITSVAPIETLKKSIGSGDITHLTQVSGIGKRTAEKIVVELRDKLAALGHTDQSGSLQQDLDVTEALIALGYNKDQIRTALKEIPEETTETNEKIRAALKHL